MSTTGTVSTNGTVFAHVAVSCESQATIERFYSKYFGFRRARAVPIGGGKEIVFLKNPEGVYLELFEKDAPPPAPKVLGDGPHWAGLRHIAFKVDNVDAKLRELGSDAKVTLGPMSFDEVIPGWRTVWVQDPESNIIEISQGYVDEVQTLVKGGSGMATDGPKTKGRKFYDEQLAYIARQDVDGLIDNHYHQDALLVGFDWTVRGRDALKKHFRGYLANLGEITVLSTDKFTETDETLFFEASVKTKLGKAQVYDAMVIRDGKIVYHFTGMK